jgi:hypothetical protein
MRPLNCGVSRSSKWHRNFWNKTLSQPPSLHLSMQVISPEQQRSSGAMAK